jgi:hypothetical protein
MVAVKDLMDRYKVTSNTIQVWVASGGKKQSEFDPFVLPSIAARKLKSQSQE